MKLHRPTIFFDSDESGGGPWAEDLTAYFGELGDDAVAAADRYMREKVQPHTTQLETTAAEAAAAREYLEDLQNDPDATLRSLIEQRYGDEFASEYEKLFGEDEDETTPTDETTPDTPALGDEERELLEWARAKREAEQRDARNNEYKTAKQQTLEKHKDVLTEDDLDLLDPFIAAAGGDMDAGVERYKAFLSRFDRKAGEEGEEDEDNSPPPVLGDGNPTPPLKSPHKKWGDFEAALRGVVDRSRASTPPVVG